MTSSILGHISANVGPDHKVAMRVAWLLKRKSISYCGKVKANNMAPISLIVIPKTLSFLDLPAGPNNCRLDALLHVFVLGKIWAVLCAADF